MRLGETSARHTQNSASRPNGGSAGASGVGNSRSVRGSVRSQRVRDTWAPGAGAKKIAAKAADLHGQHRARLLVESLPLADQHCHEVGSTPIDRLGALALRVHLAPEKTKKQFLAGLEAELEEVTARGADVLKVRRLDGARVLTEVVANPPAEDAARAQIDRAVAALTSATRAAASSRRSVLDAARAALGAARRRANAFGSKARGELHSAIDGALAHAASNPARAARILGPWRHGLLNRMRTAAGQMVKASGPHAMAAQAMADCVHQLRNLALLKRPLDKTFAGARGDLNGGDEFFQRYKYVIGPHIGPMNGAGLAEVALRRTSVVQGEAALQELRADLDKDRFRRRFDPERGEGVLSMQEVAEIAQSFADETAGQDSHLVYSFTKRAVAPSPTAKAKESTDVAPAYREQASRFVDAFFEQERGRPTRLSRALRHGISGIDHGGRESIERTPLLYVEAHTKRCVYNARNLRDRVNAVLGGPGGAEFRRTLRDNVGDDALLQKWLDSAHSEPGTWRLRGGGESVALDSPELQATLHRMVSKRPMRWQVEVGPGFSLEALSKVNRAVLDALRSEASLRGEPLSVAQLGATVHAGERIDTCPPDVLLDQVAQCVAMGTDRLGHGVILGTPMRTLYDIGPGGKLWPKSMDAAARRDPKNATYAKSPKELTALEKRRMELLDRCARDGVTIEVNLTSNLIINDRTPDEHCMHTFAAKLDDGLRITVNTDDETILNTSLRAELREVQKRLQLSPENLARVVLEGFRTRFSGRSMLRRRELVEEMTAPLACALRSSEPAGEAAVRRLCQHFSVAYDPARSTRDNIARLVGKVVT